MQVHDLINKDSSAISGAEWKFLKNAYYEHFNQKVSGCRCNIKGVQKRLKKKLGYE